MTERLTTRPTELPITLEEAKTHCRVTSTDDDDYLTALIEPVTTWVESYTNRALIYQTWTRYLDAFPRVINLHRWPVVSVTSIKYIDTDGNQQTLSASVYRVDVHAGRVTEAYDQQWPDTRLLTNAVEVAYQAGYASSAQQLAKIPAPLRHAMLLIVAHYYNNREATVPQISFEELPLGARALLDSQKHYVL